MNIKAIWTGTTTDHPLDHCQT